MMLAGYCRDRYGSFPAAIFKLWTCSMCYSYLFHTGGQLQPHPQRPWLLMPTVNSTVYVDRTIISPDVKNHSVVSTICISLSDIDCQRWTLCCTKAAECCERQIETRNTSNDQLVCPRTWDGYGCFDDTPVGTNAEILCPSYIEQSQPTGKNLKTFNWILIKYYSQVSPSMYRTNTTCSEIRNS